MNTPTRATRWAYFPRSGASGPSRRAKRWTRSCSTGRLPFRPMCCDRLLQGVLQAREDRITSDPPHTLDPPHDVVRRAINSFLLRLRHVTHAGHVRALDFPACSIQYLNDDGTELERDDKLFRAVGTL